MTECHKYVSVTNYSVHGLLKKLAFSLHKVTLLCFRDIALSKLVICRENLVILY